MGTSSPMVPKLSTEILLIPAILEVFDKASLNEFCDFVQILMNFDIWVGSRRALTASALSGVLP